MMNTMTPSTQPLLFASGYVAATEPGLHAFRFDDATGSLTACGSFAGIANPSFLVVHPNRRWLYAVSETSQGNDGAFGAVWALRFEREPLTIQPLNQQSARGDWPCHLQIDAAGRWLFVSNYGTGDGGLFPIQPDGSLGEMADFVQHRGAGPHAARQEGPHVHSAAVTPDNRFVVVADLGIDQLVIYKLDGMAGKLLPHASVNTRPGAGPRHLAFHPNGQRLYAANELDSTATLYDYDAANGALRERQTLPTLPPGAPENIVADIHVSANGQRLYVSNRGHNSIAVFDIGAEGRMTPVAIPPCGGDWPRNFALAPGGRFMLVANQYSHEVCVLPLLAGSEALGAPVARAAVTGASCVQFA